MLHVGNTYNRPLQKTTLQSSLCSGNPSTRKITQERSRQKAIITRRGRSDRWTPKRSELTSSGKLQHKQLLNDHGHCQLSF